VAHGGPGCSLEVRSVPGTNVHGGTGRDVVRGSSCEQVPQKRLVYTSRGNHLHISLPSPVNNETFFLLYFQGIVKSRYGQIKVLSNQDIVKSRYCQSNLLSIQGIVNPIYCPFKVLSIQFIVNPMYCQFSIMLIISYYDTSNYFHLFYITMNDFLSYIKTIIICYNYYNIIVVIVSRSQ